MKQLLTGLILISVFFAGCRSASEDPDEEPESSGIDFSADHKMLADYYRRTVGTPAEMPYYELVIYTYDEEHLLLEEYTEGGTEKEYVKGYLIPIDAYYKIIDVIQKNDMQDWNDEEGSSMSGAFYVCKFLLDGSYYRASSEQMPDGGIEAFEEVRKAMSSYLDQNALIYERYTEDHPAEEAFNVIKDTDQLMQYLNIIELNAENCSTYLELSSGMGSKDEEGHTTDHVLYYTLLYLENGYFPYPDFEMQYSCTELAESKETETVRTADNNNRWVYDLLDEKLWTRPYVTESFTTFKDLKITAVSGNVFCIELPDEYLYEDDDGSFFYFGDTDTKYYLAGYTGYSDYADYNDLWFTSLSEQE